MFRFTPVHGFENAALNYGLCLIGLLGVWITTQSLTATAWAFVASLHIRVTR